MGNDGDLKGRRVLVVEDELLLAMELEGLLSGRGCDVLGPAATVGQALAFLRDQQPEVAVLDVNLKGERVTPVAAVLRERGVPFVLITGYSEPQLSEPELQDAPRLDKPISSGALCCAMAQVLDASPDAAG